MLDESRALTNIFLAMAFLVLIQIAVIVAVFYAPETNRIPLVVSPTVSSPGASLLHAAPQAGLPIAGSASPDMERAFRAFVSQNAKFIFDEVNKSLQEEHRAKEARVQVNAARSYARLIDPKMAPVGNPSGTIPLVYVFDNNCGACRQQAPILEAFLKDNPNVRIHYWEFPILGPASVESAKAALAVWKLNPAKYEAVHHAFKAERSLDPASMDAALKKAGMDPAAVRTRASQPDIEELVNANRQLMQEIGVGGTPFLYLAPTVFPGVTQGAQLKEALSRFAPAAP
jgi:protein-disulfide isomerase